MFWLYFVRGLALSARFDRHRVRLSFHCPTASRIRNSASRSLIPLLANQDCELYLNNYRSELINTARKFWWIWYRTWFWLCQSIQLSYQTTPSMFFSEVNANSMSGWNSITFYEFDQKCWRGGSVARKAAHCFPLICSVFVLKNIRAICWRAAINFAGSRTI